MFRGSGRRSFNPRTPCGVRHGKHAGDGFNNQFQSTHSLRSATLCVRHPPGPGAVSIHALLAECDPVGAAPYLHDKVSIHALLAECDQGCGGEGPTGSGFNPRTPCGVRPICRNLTKTGIKFQSTHSLRSATVNRPYLQGEVIVSIHALLAECDISMNSYDNWKIVSIHALLAECDCC